MEIFRPEPVRTFNFRGCITVVLVVLLVYVVWHILVPMGPGGNDASKGQLCEANMQELALAFTQYVQDNDNTYPRGILPSPNGVGWSVALAPYTKSESMLICPSDLRIVESGMSIVSYGYNSNIAHHPAEFSLTQPSVTVLLFETSNCTAGNIPPVPGAKNGWIADGAETFSAAGNGLDGELFDAFSNVASHCTYATGVLGHRPPQPIESQYDGLFGRHLGVSNYLMADGHVAVLTGRQVSSGVDANGSADSQSGASFGLAAGVTNGKFTVTFSTR